MVVLKETHFVTPHHITEILNEGQTTEKEQNRMRGGLSTKEDRKVGAHPGGTITSTNRNHLGESILIPENPVGSPKGQITSTDTTRTPTDTKLGGRPYNFGHHKNGKEINICGLNVCGLNSKLDNGVFKDYLQMFDIFCVTESRTRVGDPVNNYKVFNMENNPKKKCQNKPKKKRQYPGIHGIQVYIIDRLASLCSIINDINFACHAALWINVANNFILGTVYIPGDRSPHYWPEFFEDFEDDICNIKPNMTYLS